MRVSVLNDFPEFILVMLTTHVSSACCAESYDTHIGVGSSSTGPALKTAVLRCSDDARTHVFVCTLWGENLLRLHVGASLCSLRRPWSPDCTPPPHVFFLLRGHLGAAPLRPRLNGFRL